MVVALCASGLHVVLGAVCTHIFDFYRRGDDFNAGEEEELHFDAFVQHASIEPVSVAVFLFERTPINASAARSESTPFQPTSCFVLYDHLCDSLILTH